MSTLAWAIGVVMLLIIALVVFVACLIVLLNNVVAHMRAPDNTSNETTDYDRGTNNA